MFHGCIRQWPVRWSLVVLTLAMVAACDQASSSDEGPVAETTAALCSDGVDNDLNGYADCDDFNCYGVGACAQSETTDALCSDGVDNDLNGYADCDDFNCGPFCP